MNKTFKINQNASFQKGAISNGLLKLAAVGCLSLLAGCSSLVNIGATEFNCAGSDGVKCKSTRQVYEMTHDGVVPEPEIADKKKRSKRFAGSAQTEAQDETVTNNPHTHADKGERSTNVSKGKGDPVIDNYVAPRLPDRPVPIRTPAQVMRIWVAPWEDTNGDLITTGYVYTEIEPRRWVIGKTEAKGNAVLRPLQTIQHQQPTN